MARMAFLSFPASARYRIGRRKVLLEHTRIEGAGDYVTLKAAAGALGQTFWQVRYLIRKHRVPTVMIGHTTLVRLSDLWGLAKGKVHPR